MKWIKYLVFGLILTYIPMWTQINLLLGSVGKNNSAITNIENTKLRQLIKSKTGMDVGTFKIAESERPYGMMMGIPGKPQLILSRGLYDDFSPDELEYVALHEAGHYDLNHSMKELLLGLFLLWIGILILRKVRMTLQGAIIVILLGLICGVGMIRFGAYNELEADSYSVKRMTNPEGMITATERFRSYYGKSFTQTDNKLIQWMFYRGNPYDNRIRMAKDEMIKREKTINNEIK